MKISGWWRLWIVLSGIYAVIVITVTVTVWPSIRSIPHHPSFNYRISDASQKVLARPNSPATLALEQKLIDADKRGAKDEARMYALEIKDRRAKLWEVEMPNGHRFEISANSTEIELERIGREYTEVLTAEVHKERAWTTFYAFLWWLCPVVAVCILGGLTRWIFQGFKNT